MERDASWDRLFEATIRFATCRCKALIDGMEKSWGRLEDYCVGYVLGNGICNSQTPGLAVLRVISLEPNTVLRIAVLREGNTTPVIALCDVWRQFKQAGPRRSLRFRQVHRRGELCTVA